MKKMIIIALMGLIIGVLVGALCTKCATENEGYVIPYSQVTIDHIETMDDGTIVIGGIYYPGE